MSLLCQANWHDGTRKPGYFQASPTTACESWHCSQVVLPSLLRRAPLTIATAQCAPQISLHWTIWTQNHVDYSSL